MAKYILFDLDGTLTDPEEGITKALAYSLEKRGLVPPPLSELRRFIGPPLYDTYEKAFGMTRDEAAATLTLYREYYAERGIFENAVIPGIPELLSELRKRGHVLAVATSKPQLYSERIIGHFGLAEHFAYVGGSNMDETRVTKREVIDWTLQNLGVTDRADVVMVGDREHDVLGAKACGVACVGVLFGYGSRGELESAGADAIAETVAELLKLL